MILNFINFCLKQSEMFRTSKLGLLGKFSLFSGLSAFIFYRFRLTQQQKENIHGVYRSVTNSTRASTVLFRSIYDYHNQLRDIAYNSEQYHKKRSEIHSRVAHRILEISKENKGIYLKLGQYIGNLEKVVPWQFTQVLKVLQDSAPQIPFQQIRTTLEYDLKCKIQDLFEYFDEHAVAAASLAQVHRAILKQTNKIVAVKIQFPFLKVQSKYDLIALRKIIELCNYLMQKRNYKDIDLLKLYQTFTGTLVEELDFRTQVQNALKTKQLFKDYPYVYVPQYYKESSTERVIVMEYIEGAKINDKERIKAMGIDPVKTAKNLIQIFTTMIFKHGFIHCDAHPGNILVRNKDNDLKHQIVLLDHGLYRTVDKEFVKNFSGLWLSLIESNPKKVRHYAQKLNIHEHVEYLPIIFLLRTINSTKKIGDPMTPEQRKYFREKDLANFQSINNILQDLPPSLMFIIRASNLIAIHNLALGNTTRYRLFEYTKNAIKTLYGTGFSYICHGISIAFKIWLFENFNWFYRILFGTLTTQGLKNQTQGSNKKSVVL